jgi:CubicO group peptidase (beta-lactamase class C family)
MRQLKLRGSRSPSPATGSTFNLRSHLNEEKISSLLKCSNTPQVSIHFEVLRAKAQAITIHHPANRNSPSDPVDGGAISDNNIYAIGSLTKILINVAWFRLIDQLSSEARYMHLRGAWERSACDLFNEHRMKRGKSTMRRLHGNPELRQLLVHENGLAPMNRYLFAPDGTFIMSEEEFIEVAPKITDDRYKASYPERGWVEYSNANHIFAGMILEAVTGQNIGVLMRELVFDWLGMKSTFMDEHSLDLPHVTANVATGYRVSANRTRESAVASRYLSDVVEVASLGAYSCTDDLAKLYRAFLEGAEGEQGSLFQKQHINDFFKPDVKRVEGGATTLGGLYGALDSQVPGCESLNRIVTPAANFPPYSLGKRADGSKCHAYYKAGTVNGFCSSAYLLLKDRAFVIVLGNSSGPVDATDHISRYILQEALGLAPAVDIVRTVDRNSHIPSEHLQNFERLDEESSGWSDDIGDVAGTYQHTRYLQQLTVAASGTVKVRGASKSSHPMRMVRKEDVVRIMPLSDGSTSAFGIDRWDAWESLQFQVRTRTNGVVELVELGSGVDIYEKNP